MWVRMLSGTIVVDEAKHLSNMWAVQQQHFEYQYNNAAFQPSWTLKQTLEVSLALGNIWSAYCAEVDSSKDVSLASMVSSSSKSETSL